MYTASPTSGVSSKYWPLLSHISIEEKLQLIAKLSDSIAAAIAKPKDSDKEATERFISKFCGAWAEAPSAEDIITAIRAERTNRPPVSFD